MLENDPYILSLIALLSLILMLAIYASTSRLPKNFDLTRFINTNLLANILYDILLGILTLIVLILTPIDNRTISYIFPLILTVIFIWIGKMDPPILTKLGNTILFSKIGKILSILLFPLTFPMKLISKSPFQPIRQLFNTTYLPVSVYRQLDNILDWFNQTAGEVLTPTRDLVIINKHTPLAKALQKIPNGQSKVLVYDNKPENIIGYINIKNAIFADPQTPIGQFVKKLQIVPESAALEQIIDLIALEHSSMLVVVDEYGAVSGVITIKEILDTTFKTVSELLSLTESEITWPVLVNGDEDIDFLNNKYDLGITKQGFETIGGFITHVFKRIPKTGEKISIGNFTFIVQEADGKTVKKVLINRNV